MRAERFGSYSIAITRAAMPILFRFQSMIRYSRLWPPPRWRVVMRPLLLRPAVFLSGSVSAFSGFVLVISSKVDTDMPRRPGEVGLYVFTGMLDSNSFEEVEPLARLERYHGLLPRPRHADRSTTPSLFASHVHDVDGNDLNFLVGKCLFNGRFDLDLVGVGRDFEDVFALVAE